MAKAPSKPKLKKTLRKVRKDVGLKRSAKVSKKDATIVLAQGVTAPPKKNFGSKATGRSPSIRECVECLDARVPRTIGLPRAVGPYTVMRTTRLIGSDADMLIFCPFLNSIASGHAEARWNDWCGVASVNGALNVTDPGNTLPINMPMSYLGPACEVVPAALTVQVMNPSALQSADGIFAMGRVNQQLDLSTSFATWNEMKARFISFYSPRLLSAGKLSLRGVKCDSYPLDMSEYSSFRNIENLSGPVHWVSNLKPAALAPIVFIQNNTTRVEIQFMVTIEWRVRFDPGNPATSSHVQHDTTSDSVWNSVIRTMSAVGHGVEELAEGVSAVGSLARGAARLAGA